MTSTNVWLIKTAVVIIIFCLAECVAESMLSRSSCLKYGHSCWGGHGKRNGGGAGGGFIRIQDDNGPRNIANTRWYLSRLVQAPADLRLWREEREKQNLVTRNLQDKNIQNDSDVETDYAKSTDEGTEALSSDAQPEEETDEVVLMEEPSASFGEKLRLYKIMKKNADKLK